MKHGLQREVQQTDKLWRLGFSTPGTHASRWVSPLSWGFNLKNEKNNANTPF